MPVSEYIDCHVTIPSYGQAVISFLERKCSDETHLTEEKVRELNTALLDATEYGKRLFDLLFPGGSDLITCYRYALAITRNRDKRLRFLLELGRQAPVELQELNWELLYDAKEEVALSRGRDIAFSRYLETNFDPPETSEIEPKLLIAVASPSNIKDYGLASIEREQVEQSIRDSLMQLGGLMQYELLAQPVTLAALSGRLESGEFHALHVQAHGRLSADGVAEIILEDNDGQAAFVPETLFSQAFEGLRDLRLITLIACHGARQTGRSPFSGLARGLVRRGCPAVLALRNAVSFEAVEQFIRYFYLYLASRGRVDRAANEARFQMYLQNSESPEWGSFALFMRLTKGRLWDSKQPARSLRAYPRIWTAAIRWARQGSILPIIGPGATQGLFSPASEVAERWSRSKPYRAYIPDTRDLPRVAKFIEIMDGENMPHQDILDNLKDEVLEREDARTRQRLYEMPLSTIIENVQEAQRNFDNDPDEPHRILAELPISTYITSNYDTLMSAALKWKGKTPDRQFCRWRNFDTYSPEYEELKGTPDKPLVFHIYGFDDSTTIALTEDDYLDFLHNLAKDDWRTPQPLRFALSSSMLLLLGFNLSDLNWKVLFRSLIASSRNALMRDRIAVLQLDPLNTDPQQMEELQLFLERYYATMQSIQVYWGTVRDFLSQLRDHLQKGVVP